MTSSPTGIRIHDAGDSSGVPAVLERSVPPALSVSEHLSRYRLMLLGIALTLFGVFGSVAIVPYAFEDDYTYLLMVVSGRPNAYFGQSVLHLSAIDGRPFSGLLNTAFFGAAGTIE